MSLRTDKPLDPDKFFPWVQDLVQKEGPSILRCKGSCRSRTTTSGSCFRACT